MLFLAAVDMRFWLVLGAEVCADDGPAVGPVTECRRLTPRQQRVLDLLRGVGDDPGVVRLSNAILCAHLGWTVGRNGTSTMLSEVLRELEALGYITRAVVHKGGSRTERTIVVVACVPQPAAPRESSDLAC